MIDHLETRIDASEAAVLNEVRQPQLGQIHRLEQEVQQVQRRITSRSRSNSRPPARRSSPLPGLEHSWREYLRDIGDHLVQVAGELGRQTKRP